MKTADFKDLELDKILNAVEKSLDCRLSGFASPLPSYINRVYELETGDRQRLIAKFYRPGRWSHKGIEQEHQFVRDCASCDIPVVMPLELKSGKTIGEEDGFCFAVYPKRAGRWFEVITEEDWKRIGRIVARIHNAGADGKPSDRITMAPQNSTMDDVDFLLETKLVTPMYRDKFKSVCMNIIELSSGLFEDTEMTRIHGDCHNGNLLDRLEDGIMVIDFDDMAYGPPVQDLWLLLPDYADRCRNELDLLLRGYSEFRDFDDASLKLIEPLRAMRIIYFLAWCARQHDDLKFKHNFPDWGTDAFWRKEVYDLEQQYSIIRTSLGCAPLPVNNYARLQDDEEDDSNYNF